MRLVDADALAMKLRHMGYMDEDEEVQEVIDRFAEECGGDLISRQDAIDALQKEINKGIPPFDDVIGSIRCGVRLARNIIEDLPSTEPVIRCKDCKYFEQYTDDGTLESVLKMHQWDGECSEWVGHTYMGWFCSRAERRTDEVD